MEFSELISQAAEIMQTGTSILWLHDSEEFEQVYENPKRYMNDALEYISSKDSKHKYVAVISMQKLPYEDMLFFYKDIFKLFQAGEISWKELSGYIFVGDGFGDFFEVNYDREEVRSLLKEIASDPKISQEFRNSIEEVISGQWTEAKREFRRAQEYLEKDGKRMELKARMIQSGKHVKPSAPDMTEEEIQFLVDRIVKVKWVDYGNPELQDDEVVVKIVLLGKKAAPYLAEKIDNDTPSIAPGWDTVGDLANTFLKIIYDRTWPSEEFAIKNNLVGNKSYYFYYNSFLNSSDEKANRSNRLKLKEAWKQVISSNEAN